MLCHPIGSVEGPGRYLCDVASPPDTILNINRCHSLCNVQSGSVVNDMKKFIFTVKNFLAVIEAQEREAERSTVVHRNCEEQTPAVSPKGSETD